MKVDLFNKVTLIVDAINMLMSIYVLLLSTMNQKKKFFKDKCDNWKPTKRWDKDNRNFYDEM